MRPKAWFARAIPLSITQAAVRVMISAHLLVTTRAHPGEGRSELLSLSKSEPKPST